MSLLIKDLYLHVELDSCSPPSLLCSSASVHPSSVIQSLKTAFCQRIAAHCRARCRVCRRKVPKYLACCRTSPHAQAGATFSTQARPDTDQSKRERNRKRSVTTRTQIQESKTDTSKEKGPCGRSSKHKAKYRTQQKRRLTACHSSHKLLPRHCSPSIHHSIALHVIRRQDLETSDAARDKLEPTLSKLPGQRYLLKDHC